MPKIGRVQTIKYAPPPPELPIYGQVDPAKCSFIGRTNYVAALEEKKYLFGIKRIDRKKHLYIVGKSGVGKSKLLELLVRQDIAYGFGVCLMDPHREAINAILDFVPDNRVDDVVLIDPTDLKNPVCFNPLADVKPEYRHQFAQGIIEAAEKQFGSNWKPRLEHVLRFAVLALLEYPRATLMNLIDLLTNDEFRSRVTATLKDETLKKFWEADFPEWSKKYEYDTEAIIPLVNKLNHFFADPFLKAVFSSKDNKLDFGRLVAENKLVFINLSRDRLGDAGSSFFGSVVLAKLKQAGLERAMLPERERSDFYIYIDEFNSLITETFQSLLAEARKYSFSFTISHQFMHQLLSGVQSTVLGSVGNIIVFRVGGDDAQRLKSEMAPVFDIKDMINLGTQEFYIKMMIDGEAYDPFSAETLKVLPPPHASFRQKILDRSRTRYSISG